MKKRSNSILFWLCCFVAVLVLYAIPFALLVVDTLLGTLWYEKHAPEPLRQALAHFYFPVAYLAKHFFG